MVTLKTIELLLYGAIIILIIQYFEREIRRRRRVKKYFMPQPPTGKSRFVIMLDGMPYYCNRGGENLALILDAKEIISVLERITYAQTEIACDNCSEQSCEPVHNRVYLIHENPAYSMNLKGFFTWTKLNSAGKIIETNTLPL